MAVAITLFTFFTKVVYLFIAFAFIFAITSAFGVVDSG